MIEDIRTSQETLAKSFQNHRKSTKKQSKSIRNRPKSIWKAFASPILAQSESKMAQGSKKSRNCHESFPNGIFFFVDPQSTKWLPKSTRKRKMSCFVRAIVKKRISTLILSEFRAMLDEFLEFSLVDFLAQIWTRFVLLCVPILIRFSMLRHALTQFFENARP